jgi:hypothetical protein
MTIDLIPTLLALACFGMFGVLLYLTGRARQTHAPKHEQQAHSGRDALQAGKNVTINHGADALLYFSQCKDLQKTVDQLFTQLELKVKTLDRYHEQFLKQEKKEACLESKLKAQADEIDGLRNELNEMKYAQLLNRFPILPVTPSKKEVA